jgi:Sulfotransferase domain
MTSLQRIIWLASFPKSGNTWTRVLLANYFMPPGQAPDINTLYRFTTADIRQDFFDRVNGGPFVARDLAHWLETRPRALRAIAASKNGHHFVKTHCQVRRIGGRDLILPEVTAAAIYVIRNPFDLVLSYSRHLSEPVDQTITRMADRDATNASGTGIFELIGRWDEHIASWIDAPGLQRHVMRYEDMVADTERAFRGLFAFLRTPVQDGQLRRAIRAASFDSLQKQEQQKGFRERPPGMKQFFATGRAGGWREALTPAQVARIRAEFPAALERHYPEMLDETAEVAARA